MSDAVVPIGAGAKSYPTSIPVKTGDILGSWVEQRDGVHNVDLTCAFGGDPDQHSDWWYDTTPNVLPPESPVSIAGTHHDTGWTYSISAELTAAPSVTGLTPAVGPATGGTHVTITGTGLASATAVTFGGAAATITSATPTSVTVTTPAHAAGSADVSVRTPGGSATLTSGFTYEAVPADAAGSELPATPAAPQPLGARTTCDSTGRCVTTGRVPDGATQVTETASGGTAAITATARASARITTVCAMTARNGSRTYSCAVRLGAGRWTITTRARAGSTGARGFHSCGRLGHARTRRRGAPPRGHRIAHRRAAGPAISRRACGPLRTACSSRR